MKYRIDLARKVAKHKIDQFFLAEKDFWSPKIPLPELDKV